MAFSDSFNRDRLKAIHNNSIAKLEAAKKERNESVAKAVGLAIMWYGGSEALSRDLVTLPHFIEHRTGAAIFAVATGTIFSIANAYFDQHTVNAENRVVLASIQTQESLGLTNEDME